MTTNEVDPDAVTMAYYRAEIERAVSAVPAARDATAAMFAALDLRDGERRELMAIAREVADYHMYSGCPCCAQAEKFVARARTLLGR